MSSLQQNWRRGQNRFCLEEMGVGGREMAQTMYAYMNKRIIKKKLYNNFCSGKGLIHINSF
jgi:hypothetical protein